MPVVLFIYLTLLVFGGVILKAGTGSLVNKEHLPTFSNVYVVLVTKHD
jgi:hypothetical protein